MEEYFQKQLQCLLAGVKPADPESMALAEEHWDGIAKPIAGLGKFEDLFVKLAGIQRTADVQTAKKAVVVFCADNGVVEEGVTQTDSSVTAIVTDNFAKGTASVCRMAACAGVDVFPVDMGVSGEIHEPGVRNCKIAPGTRNLAKEPAMTREQALEAIHTGIRLAGECKDMGYQLAAVGEMGIGNTTTSSAIASVMLKLPVEEVTGRGAGLTSEGLERKIKVIKKAIELHQPNPEDPLSVLAALGGFDLAGMCGFMLGGAIYHLPVVLDGMIALTAALLAKKMCPEVTDYLLPSHEGKEPACRAALKELDLSPVICGNLALGEGTGAVLLFPLLEMAGAVYRENTTFGELKIKAYEKY